MREVIERMSRTQANMMDVLFKYTLGELTEEETSYQLDKVVREGRHMEELEKKIPVLAMLS